MRKFYIPLVLLSATIVSCSQNELNKSKEISSSDDLITLNVATAKTKGADVTTSTMETSSTGVKLHIEDSGEADALTSGAYDFSATGSDWSQTSATTVTWGDIVFPVDFYSMHDGESQSLTVSGGVATLDYEIEDTVANHKDLVYHASSLSAIPSGGTVNAFHKHALSKLHLYAATGTNKIYIARVNLVNVDGDGTVTIQSVDASELSTANGVSWSNGTSSGASYEYYYVGDSSPTALQTTTTNGVDTNPLINTDDDAPMMVIPQLTTAATQESVAAGNITGTYVEVIYYLTDSSGAPLVGYPTVAQRSDASLFIDDNQGLSLYVMAAFPLTYDFEPNKEYNLTLGVGKEGSTGGLLVVDNYVDKDGVPVELTLADDGTTTTTPEIPTLEIGDEILADSSDDIDIIVTSGDWDGTYSVSMD
ncbi:MAG: hypothetical protein R3Y15_04640 [Rikenellaceae bacterium]